ncbi:hypothetical protein AAZX31_11G131200 [Glycine max]
MDPFNPRGLKNLRRSYEGYTDAELKWVHLFTFSTLELGRKSTDQLVRVIPGSNLAFQ